MTLYEEVQRALARVEPRVRDWLVSFENNRIYGRHSKDLDYGTKVEVKLYSEHKRPDAGDEARIARARASFLRGILSGALHALGELPVRPETRYPKPGDGFLTHASWVAHLKEIDKQKGKHA